MYSMLLDIDLDERHHADFQGDHHPVSKWQILALFRAICSQNDLTKSFMTSPKKLKEKSFHEKDNSLFCHWQKPTHIWYPLCPKRHMPTIRWSSRSASLRVLVYYQKTSVVNPVMQSGISYLTCRLSSIGTYHCTYWVQKLHKSPCWYHTGSTIELFCGEFSLFSCYFLFFFWFCGT